MAVCVCVCVFGGRDLEACQRWKLFGPVENTVKHQSKNRKSTRFEVLTAVSIQTTWDISPVEW